MFHWIRRGAASRWTPAVIIALGLALRIAWLWHEPARANEYAEAGNVAFALWSKGEFADAFYPGQSPTAHLMPPAPLIAAAIYNLFGYSTTASDWALSLWSVSLTLFSFWMLAKTFERLGLPRLAAMGALAFLCVVPINFALETIWFRVWEGSLAIALASLLVFLLADWDGKIAQRWKIYVLALILASLFFVQPPLGLAGFAAAALFALRNFTAASIAEAVFAAALALALFIAPWSLRNAHVLGAPVLIRSNMGLELAVAFHPAAISPADAEKTYWERMAQVHPAVDGAGRVAFRKSGGEISYNAKLKRETLAWIKANPLSAAQLWSRHLTEMLFPPRWFFKGAKQVQLKLAFHWMLSAVAIAGIGISIFGDRRLLYPAVMVAVTILPYTLVQPTARYRYLIFALLVFWAAYFAQWAIQRIRQFARMEMARPGGVEPPLQE